MGIPCLASTGTDLQISNSRADAIFVLVELSLVPLCVVVDVAILIVAWKAFIPADICHEFSQ